MPSGRAPRPWHGIVRAFLGFFRAFWATFSIRFGSSLGIKSLLGLGIRIQRETTCTCVHRNNRKVCIIYGHIKVHEQLVKVEYLQVHDSMRN
jgi:hypothetical protein